MNNERTDLLKLLTEIKDWLKVNQPFKAHVIEDAIEMIQADAVVRENIDRLTKNENKKTTKSLS
jgi:proline dehydrogenase